ncbi:MAG: hypothetical protein ABH800_00725 [Candidatus Nealsonbacteria bacterium]
MKKLKNNLNRFFYTVARNIFRSFLIIFFLSLIIGSFMFYKYGFTEKEIDPVAAGEVIQFKENLYQKVLVEWNSREKIFEEVKTKTYVNPFE